MRAVETVLVLLLLGHLAFGQEGTARPATPEQAADKVLTSVGAGDSAALKALAEEDHPDPWLVADALCEGGGMEAALAFATAAPRPDTEALPAWIRDRRSSRIRSETRHQLAEASRALEEGRNSDALEILSRCSEVRDPFETARIEFMRGWGHFHLGHSEKGAAAFRLAGEQAATIGWLRRAADALTNAGVMMFRGAAYADALSVSEALLPIVERRGTRLVVARTLGNVGLLQRITGRLVESERNLKRTLALAEELGDEGLRLNTIINLGELFSDTGRWLEATTAIEQGLDLATELGDVRRRGILLNLLALDEIRLGELERAEEHNRQSLEVGRQAENERLVQGCRLIEGLIQLHRGSYARAIILFEGVAEKARAEGWLNTEARALANLGIAFVHIGDPEAAVRKSARALELARKMGDFLSELNTLIWLGNAYWQQTDLEQALESYQQALALASGRGVEQQIGACTGNIGMLHLERGDHARAVEFLEASLATAREIPYPRMEVISLHHLSLACRESGDQDRALALARLSEKRARETENRSGLVWALDAQARAHLERGEVEFARSRAREAVSILKTFADGLAASEGARSRESLAGVIETGLAAALAAGDPEEVLFFLETGRAGGLLEALHARKCIRTIVVPEELREAENRARARESAAAGAYLRARDGGRRDEIRRARVELDESRREVAEVTARIQRAARSAADLVHPEPVPLADLRKTLDEDEALVLFGAPDGELMSLVVTNRAGRIVRLGAESEIDQAVDGCLLEDHPYLRPAGIEDLAKRIVVPLDLSAKAKRVLVSPAGRLGYLPFSLLFPGREVVYVPSATVYASLRPRTGLRGVGVLGIGDPVYPKASRLSPLPATREEVRAVADTHLLGEKAAEQDLREAMEGREAWRALHFACHGRIDPESPLQSSLALTPAGEEDGRLTCLELFRWKIPADLVVLSACETARGRVYRAEGIMGLTRAFMMAGAPRVLCSLWKVDDEATKALMVRFYELWNPDKGSGLPAATALEQAQRFVRSHEKWKHPYYWAAWVLWGLPD